MNNNQQIFNIATIATKLKNVCVNLDKVLVQEKHPEIIAIRQKLLDELKKHQQQGVLTVAFVGQYNAGKSTTISALTGRRDIRIHSDIATDETSTYEWNGIKLIDTPGLFTDRKDHDDVTYDAINKADLLVFCLTHMLFDSLTIENFKKLAYEKGYRWKMMLVVNKMSDQAGDENQKVVSYRYSLAEALKPYKLDEFPLSFIDAKDYCEGVDTSEEFLIEVSRFQTFIEVLNNFTKQRAIFTRFDTPVRIALSHIDEALLSFTRDSNEDSAYIELLTRLSKTVQKERERLRTKIRSIALRLSSEIANEGIKLASAVGGRDNIEALSKDSENNVKSYCEQAGNELDHIVETAIESLQVEVQEVLQSDLTQAFVARLEVNANIYAKKNNSGRDINRLRGQVEALKQIGETVGAGIKNLATSPTAVNLNSGFMNASNVAGSNLHHGVYAIGKLIGFDFKPWQAVNIAKDIANFAMFIRPIIGVFSLAMDIHAVQQEEELDQKLSEARKDITSQFITIAKNLENQIEQQCREVEIKVYSEIDKQIAVAREQEESAISTSNTWVNQLAEVRKEFELILSEITKATQLNCP